VRKIILAMMTTLNGRLDDPTAWVHGVGDDQYRTIEELYATYDTLLIGRTTYEEMAAYWPSALLSGEGTQTNRTMARYMNDYKKLVFSRSGNEPLTEWNNVEQIITPTNEALAHYLTDLKAQPGGNIHLSGGARFAQTVIARGLVDEFSFFVYPVFSPGQSWFAELADALDLTLERSGSYGNGVVHLHYRSREANSRARPERFTELLAS
jgi:dihydrofolate reductase